MGGRCVANAKQSLIYPPGHILKHNCNNIASTKGWEGTATTYRMGWLKSVPERVYLFPYMPLEIQAKRSNNNSEDFPDRSYSHKAKNRLVAYSHVI